MTGEKFEGIAFEDINMTPERTAKISRKMGDVAYKIELFRAKHNL